MGYLILDKAITVPFGPGHTRSLLPGVNKDFTPEMAEHWYVRAAGGRYVETLEEAHKSTPSAREAATRARDQWQQSVRAEMAAHGTQVALRRDLVRLEKEFGVDTEAADDSFEKEIDTERKRLKSIESEATEQAETQAAAEGGADAAALAADAKAAEDAAAEEKRIADEKAAAEAKVAEAAKKK